MKIKRMNRNMLPAFRNKLSPTPEIFDSEGKNKAAVLPSVIVTIFYNIFCGEFSQSHFLVTSL